MKKSGTKIIIKPRRSRQVEPEPEPEPEPERDRSSEIEDASEEANDEGVDEAEVEGEDITAESDAEAAEEDVAGGGDRDADGDGDSAPEPEPEPEPEPQPVVRGRPRGRPRLSNRPANVGTGRPRGRPRGSGRGRGRGRGRGGGDVLTLRLPKRGGDGSDGEENDGSQVTGQPGDDNDAGDVLPVQVVQQVSRKNFPLPPIEGDAYVTENDPKGDTKIDMHGNLLGGRQFKSQTFILPGRHPERRYILAIDAARTSGFRDSLYYFRRNPLALKLIATQSEKDYLIEIGKLGGHLRTRSVTLVTARSAYKLHGAKMLVDGRIGVDDYYEEKAVREAEERGLKAGDLASELLEQQQAATNEAAAGGGAQGKVERSGLGLYRTGGPTTVFGGSGLGPYSDGPLNVAKKAMLTREGVTDENWMLVMAQRTREANGEFLKGRNQAIKSVNASTGAGGEEEEEEGALGARSKRLRRDTNGTAPGYGVYEPHTANVHYESSTQPTRAQWEVLPSSRNVLGGTKVGNGAWGVAWVDTVMKPPDPSPEEERARECRRVLEGLV